jgi:AmiR/NasT family two-component response regulator
MQQLRIILGDSDDAFISTARQLLIELGHIVIDTDDSGTMLLRKIRTLNPDVVIVDVNMKGISGFEISSIVEGEGICPCIVTFKNSPFEYSIKLEQKLVYAYIQKPINITTLSYTVDNAYFNFKKMMGFQKSLNERKTIEKAKGLLMEKYKMNESKAYEYMRKKSMEKSTSMYKISRAIIEIIKKKDKK